MSNCRGRGSCRRSPVAAEPREHDCCHGERDVEEEDPPPGSPFDERSSQRGPPEADGTRACSPEPDRPSALLPEGLAKKSEAPGREQGSGGALENPPDDEHSGVRRCSGQSRGEREPDRSRDEGLPPAQPIAERAGDEVEGSEGQRVREDDPLLPREADSELFADHRHGNAHGGHVGHRRTEDRGAEGQAAGGLRCHLPLDSHLGASNASGETRSRRYGRRGAGTDHIGIGDLDPSRLRRSRQGAAVPAGY